MMYKILFFLVVKFKYNTILFQRTLAIPSPVDTNSIEAELKDGVLKVFLPKRAEDKPKQIELKVK